MSIKAVAWVLDQTITDPTAKLVLISLANCLNSKTGKCFPTFERISQESSCARSTVIRKLQWLEQNGWISINREFGDDGRQLANSYILHFAGGNLLSADSNCKGEGGKLQREGAVAHTGEGCIVDTPYKKLEEIPEDYSLSEKHSDPQEKLGENQKEKPQEELFASKAKNKKPNYPQAFENAWKLYPTDCNMSKKQGFSEWQRLDASDRALVLAAIPNFKAHCQKNPDYRPVHFCRFISQRRFDGFQPNEAQTLPHECNIGSFDDQRWQKILNFGRRRKEWQVSLWGPMPNRQGALVPAKLVLPSDGIGWAETYLAAAQ